MRYVERAMSVLLLQLDGKLPNLALMRLAAHHAGDVILRKNPRWIQDELGSYMFPMLPKFKVGDVLWVREQHAQKRADERIPHLLRTPAAVRFLSCEPLLEGLDLRRYLTDIDWLVTGAESGPGHRLCDEQWVRALRDQCLKLGVAFFYKQKLLQAKKIETPELDGRKWTEFPSC